MWKALISNTGSRILSFSIHNKKFIRNFLSDAYKCKSSWDKRFTAPILQKVNLDELYYELEDNFHATGQATAIDVDIYANSIKEADYLDSLADLLHKLRLSRETSNTLDSTSHAVIRLFHEKGEHEELLKILNDRINYGIFLDHFTANMLLDHFIESKDYTSAAKIASMLMLQEDFSNAISKALSLYACVMYVQEPSPFEAPVEEVVVETKPQGKKKKDEIKIRVKFLRNPYFDDHFDLRDGNLLVGKTLTMIGQSLEQNILSNSCIVMGLILHQKYEKACDFLKSNMNIYDEVISFAKITLEKVEAKENEQSHVDNLKTLINKLNGESGFYKRVEEMVTNAVAREEQNDITEHIKLHEEWINTRDAKLQEQLQRFERSRRIEEAERKLKELEEEERKLWFFENEEQLDLEIEKKKVYYPKRWFGKKKKPRAIDEDYIPPEVQKQL